MNPHAATARSRFLAAHAVGREVATSSIVIHELWFGVAKSPRREADRARLERLLADGVVTCAFDDDDALAAARVRAELKRQGAPIGPYDVLIAGQALARGATLVTANIAELSRVEGLAWEDWAT